MSQRAIRTSWIDQFVLRSDGPDGALAPFTQAISAAELLVKVAEDRSGLARPTYDTVGTLRYQAALLGDFARRLESDFHHQVRAADDVVRPDPLSDRDSSWRARTLMSSLSAAVEATGTLTEICHALLGVAESLMVVDRPKSRIQIVAAVEALRSAASTAQITVLTNIRQITDAVLYDKLTAMMSAVDQTLVRADQISRSLRASAHGASTGDPVPPQRNESPGQVRSLFGG